MNLKPGDIFCTRNPMLLGRMINAVQKIQSKDNESTYSHSGIILNTEAQTFEALWTNKRQNLYNIYSGRKVLVGRHRNMTEEAFRKGWDGIKHHEGEVYAGHRLLLFLIPYLPKYLNLGLGVCSELTAKFLYKSGIWNHWKGLNPDDIADRIRDWKGFEIVFEGMLE